MDNQIIISIIIPVYNTEKYIQECIESLINQRTDEVEVILINDGSTGHSENICRKYEEDFIIYVTQSHQGLPSARNKGLEVAKGKYIMFIDSDDYIDDGVISEIKNIISEKEPDVIFGQLEAFREPDVKREFYEADLNTNINDQSVDDIILQLSCLNINIAPSVRYIIKKECLKNYSLYFRKIPYEDVEWSARVLAQIESIYIYAKRFYKYRLRSNSLSASQDFRMYYTYSKIVIDLYNFSLKLNNPKRRQFVHNRCRYLLYRIRNEMYKLDDQERVVLKQFFQKNLKLVEQLYNFYVQI